MCVCLATRSLELTGRIRVFNHAAQSPDPALARGVVHIPTDNMSLLIQQRLTTLTTILLTHPTTEVRMATLGWHSHHPITNHEHTLFTRLLALLYSPFPDEYALAAKVVFSIYTGNDATLVGYAIKSLLGNRPALQIICETFSSTFANIGNISSPRRRPFWLPYPKTG